MLEHPHGRPLRLEALLEEESDTSHTPASPADYVSIYDHRDNMFNLLRKDAEAKIFLTPEPGIQRKETLVRLAYSTSIPCYEYLPPDSDSLLPTLFYIPGTASRGALLKPEEAVCTRLCIALQCRVISIFHRLAPESRHPIPFNDVCQVINHYVHNTSEPMSCIAIAGYS